MFRADIDRPEGKSWREPAKKLPALTGIRAVAALWVMIYHFKDNPLSILHLADRLPPLKFGYLGVDLFFILSGFVIAHAHVLDFTAWRSAMVRRFYGLRLARMYPVHIAVLFALLFTTFVGERFGLRPHDPQQFTAIGFVQNVFLTQGWFPQPLSWNAPAWSISSEWFAYLAFPALAFSLRNVSREISAALLAGGLIAFILCYSSILSFDLDRTSGLALVRVGTEFLTGFLLYKTVGASEARNIPWTAIFSALVVTAWLSDPKWTAMFLVLSFVPLVAACRDDRSVPGRLLSFSAAVYLGEISYSIYMVHEPFQAVAGKLVLLLIERSHGSLIVAATSGLALVVLTIGAAAAMYQVVEAPARSWLRGRISSGLPAPAVG